MKTRNVRLGALLSVCAGALAFGCAVPGVGLAQSASPIWAKLQPVVPYKSSEEQYAAYRAQAKPATNPLPDWSGIWTRDAGGPPFNFDPAGGEETSLPGHAYGRVTAQITPQNKATLDKRMADIRRGIEWDYLSYCLPAGFPRLLTEPFLREFIVTPKETWWINEQQSEVRRIHTDGRGHVPEEEAFPLWEGDSIGFWDGDTLVVHTTHLKPGFYQRGQPDYSDKTSTVERVRKIDADTIEDLVTVYDPVGLVKPWTVLQHYVRVQNPKEPELRIDMWSCEENNNVVKDQTGATNFVLPGEEGYKDPSTRLKQPAADPTSGH